MILINYDRSKCHPHEIINMKYSLGDYFCDALFISYDSFEELFESVDNEKYNEIKFMGFYFEDSEYVNNIVDNLVLPSSLYQLSCDNNNLSKLPELPEGLGHLYCPNNNLTKLPKLPNSLEVLYCHDNDIECLESLPDELISIFASDNEITKIINFPKSLQHIECQNNKLKYLPELPNGISGFHLNDNELIDIPNNYYTVYDELRRKSNMGINNIGPEWSLWNNPICTLINHNFDNNTENYINWKLKMQKVFVRKIEDWYLECKYNPEYLVCKKRIEKEYNELYSS